MVFSSSIFLFAFLPLVLVAYFVVGHRFKNLILLVFSLGFYAWGEGFYLWVMLYTVLSAWYSGILLDKCQISSRRKWILFAGCIFTLLPLIYFKYWYFILDNLSILMSSLSLKSIQAEQILLPIGISFFTFQAISYIADVYQKTTPAQKSILNLGLYISLFPQLIAGPIVRYHDIQKQLAKRKVRLSDFADGCERFIYGLGKKVLIANPLGDIADRLFSLPASEVTLFAAWLGVICYALQIYFDFSGYSSMAIGLGKMFGFKIPENFNYPYCARSIREFWRRWHISLSRWFRDYVYIPLGGNRDNFWKTSRNLLIVFLLCGFWHGASWSFIVWGLIHGCFLALERGRLGQWINCAPAVLKHIYVLLVVLTAWVFFKTEDITYSLQYSQGMWTFSGEWQIPAHIYIKLDAYFYTVLLLGLLLSCPVYPRLKHQLFKLMSGFNAPGQLILSYGHVLLVLSILILSVFEIALGSYNPFIYFRF